jgi:hypothetical protein
MYQQPVHQQQLELKPRRSTGMDSFDAELGF